MAESKGLREFLVEALPLVATYLYSPSVTLVPHALGVPAEARDDIEPFFRELADRHVLACAATFRSVITEIERSPSSWRTISRISTRGLIKGRLDVPRYLGGRTVVSKPPLYPVVINAEDFGTPENALATVAMRILARQLATVRFRPATAEARLAAEGYVWLRNRLATLPWAGVKRSGLVPPLTRQVDGRVRRRQTGNQPAYLALLEWIDEWQVRVDKLGVAGVDSVANGILAFPQSDFFWDRVLEIWCLQEVANSLVRIGCKLSDVPVPLYERHKSPIFRMHHEHGQLSVWFQRQKPVGIPRWRYDPSEAPFAGIPDVVITLTGQAPFLLDAKARWMASSTRPEETYKMLGYLENFRETFAGHSFHGALVFYGSRDAPTIISGPYAGRITLLTAAAGEQGDGFRSDLDTSLRAWLSSAQSVPR